MIDELKKIEQSLHEAYMFHLHKDEMNARGHLAKKVVQSPLTTSLENSCKRISKLIEGNPIVDLSHTISFKDDEE